MATLLSIVFLLAFCAVWPLGIAYYYSLHQFGKSLAQFHPGVVEALRSKETFPTTSLSRSYAIFRAISAGKPVGETLAREVMEQYKVTRTVLYAAMTTFLLLVLSGLSQELVA